MGSCPVEVHFTSKLKNCFVNISPYLEREWRTFWQGEVKGIQLQFDNKSCYTCWSTFHCSENLEQTHVIEIGRTFAQCLGLIDKQSVIATPLSNISSCQQVTLTPINQDDYEIAALNSTRIESDLRNQLLVVWEEAVLPIWVQKNNHFFAKLTEIQPSSACCQLEEFTKVNLVCPEKNFETSENIDHNKEKTNVTQDNKEEITPVEKPSVNLNSSIIPAKIGNITARPYRYSLGKSLYEVGDKYKPRAYNSPLDYTTALHASGVFNFVKSVIHGPYSAEEMRANEKSFSSVIASNNFQLPNLTQNETKKVEKRPSVLQSVKLPLSSYYRVQSLIPSCDVTKSRKVRPRTSLPNTLLQQPSTVFAYCADLLCEINRLTENKTACSNNHFSTIVSLRKIFTLKERVDMNPSGSKRSDIISSNDNSPNDDFRDSYPSKLFEKRYFGSITRERSISDGKSNSEQSAIVRLVLTTQKQYYYDDKKLMEEELLPGHIAITQTLRRQLKLGLKSSVFVDKIKHEPSTLLGIVLNPFGENAHKMQNYHKNEITSAFTSWVKEITRDFPLILSSRMLISFNMGPDVKSEFLLSGIGNDSPNSSFSKKQQYFFLGEGNLPKVSINVGDVIHPSYYILSPYPVKNTKLLDEEYHKCSISSFGGFHDIYKTCLNYLLHGLSCQPVSQQLRHSKTCGNALLIYGSGCVAGGSGKSSLANALCQQLSRHPYLAYVKNIDCLSLRGKRIETIRKLWQKMFTDAAWYEGAVLLFDDLDQLIPAPSLTQEHGPEANYTLRLAQVFKDFLCKEIRSNSKIVVIVTINSRDSIHPSLLTTHGNHVFGKTVEIPLPDLEQRLLILNAILKRKHLGFPTQDLRDIAAKTEGCSAKDLNTLITRTCQVVTLRSSEQAELILPQDFNKALEDFKPASLHGIKLHQGNNLTWNDVGGLHEIKQTLKETLEWPVKFPDLYSNVPLRLPSGILLYGYPGSGKTMLAGVVASVCSMNFISIKGPELLSKYIGASEQAVRDLFHRAESAKPCILFFDEFDSMAPRRGHDNTGVTDRVVNQLLTQLDGVEGLHGVYILAASSRPDLIDPALLRPGRLDKSVFCPLPTQSERLEILKALSSKLNLHSDVNFEVIAEQTRDFSGADLKALLSNAQVKRIHATTSMMSAGNKTSESSKQSDLFFVPHLKDGLKLVDADEHSKISKQVTVLEDNFFNTVYGKAKNSPKLGFHKDGVCLTQHDIVNVLTKMAPSVSSEERQKYNRIYQSFQVKKSQPEKDVPLVQRATLA